MQFGELSKGNVIEKVKQVIPLILPLFLQSFQKAEKIAMAMDARGYGLIEKRSRYFTSRVTIWDVIFVVAQIMLFCSRHVGNDHQLIKVRTFFLAQVDPLPCSDN